MANLDFPHVLFGVAAMLILSGCKADAPTIKLPKVEMTDVPAPAQPAVVIKRGDTLNNLAETAYRHEDFSHFLQRFNGIADVTRLQVGFQLQTPSLAAFSKRDSMPATSQQ